MSADEQIEITPDSESEPEVAAAEVDVDEEDETEYEIDHIRDSRIRTIKGKKTSFLEFLIHWKGYDDDEDSWTTASQFEADDPPVLKFYQKYPNKPRLDGFGPLKVNGKKNSEKIESKKEEEEPALTPKKLQSTDVVKKVASSPINGKRSGDIRSFFGGLGQENRKPNESREAKIKEKKVVEPKLSNGVAKAKQEKQEKPVVEKKRKRADSEEDEFVPDVLPSDPEDDLDSVDDGAEEAAEGTEDDLESVNDIGESLRGLSFY